MADVRTQQARDLATLRLEKLREGCPTLTDRVAEDVLYLADRVEEADAALDQAVMMANDNAADVCRLADRVAALETALREIDTRLTTLEGDNVTTSDAAAVHVRMIARAALAGAAAEPETHK